MRIGVIGGDGLVGERVVATLRLGCHDVVAFSAAAGASVGAGEKLAKALVGAEVLVDVASPPSPRAREARAFLGTLSRNLVSAAAIAGVSHHVSLSMVGVDHAQAGTYLGAKAAQEHRIRASGMPYTIVRSTQSLEYLDRSFRLAASSEAAVRLPMTLVQPIAADDLAQAIAEIASAPARNSIVEVAGPEPVYLPELARLILSAREDPRRVVASANARYFGAVLSDHSLMPGADPWIGRTSLQKWLRECILPG